MPAQFKEASLNGTAAKAAPSAAAEPQKTALSRNELVEWWRLFGSRELNGLIDRALANNPDLRIATLRVAQAKARSEQAVADELPVVTVPYQAKTEAPRGGIGSLSEGDERKTRSTYQLSLRGDWRVDLWGERRALAESSEMQLWRATYQRDDARRLLIGNVVATFIEYLSLNDRIRVGRETETVLRGMLESVKNRMEIGDATAIDFEQQRAAVFSVQATIPGLELQRENAANSLAQLLGVTPASLTLPESGLQSLNFPPALPGVPAQLLLLRPDVRAVETRLLSADADIDVARTRLLPPLDLTAQRGYGSYFYSQLFKPHSMFWSLIANLSATIFDYGKRANEVRFARALHEEMVETYVRVLYGAVRETEDAIAGITMNGQRLEAQEVATDASLRAWQLSAESYGYGAIDYLTLLDTQRTYHRNLDELHRVRMERYKSLAAMYAALGGGVDATGLPKPTGQPGGLVAVSSTGEASTAVNAEFTPQPEEDDEYWLVEIAGLQDRAGIAHVWRDLRERFPEAMTGRSLRPRLQGHVSREGRLRSAWYRLFVGAFPNSEAAEDLCNRLMEQLQRCRIVSSRDEAFTDRADPPDESADSVPLPQTAATPATASDTTPVPPPTSPADEIPLPTIAAILAVPNPATARAPVSGTAPTSAGTEAQRAYAVQLDTLPNPAAAETMAAKWQAKGYRAYVYIVKVPSGATKYSVRAGNYPERAQAQADAAVISNREKTLAVTVPIQLDADGQPRSGAP